MKEKITCRILPLLHRFKGSFLKCKNDLLKSIASTNASTARICSPEMALQ
uniref:Uncharacterized protein n=1 Tax=Parascaris equorum TaxID=6256 RepID=A0A914RXI4_PAREQ